MNKGIQKYIRDNFDLISKLILIYIIGIVTGIMLFVFTDIKNEYTKIINDTFEMSKQDNFEGINIISNGIKNNMVYIGVLYFSLITIIAPILIFLMISLKAINTGLYMCSMFKIFGIFKGIIVSFISVILPNLFSLVGYIVICTNIIVLFNYIAKNEKFDVKVIIKHIYYLIISLSLISFSLVVEQLMTSATLNIYTNI
jgi:hypothetical protein